MTTHDTVEGRDWSVTITTDGAVLTDRGRTTRITHGQLHQLHTRRSWFRWFVLRGNDRALRLRGAGQDTARRIDRALAAAQVQPRIDAVLGWHDRVEDAFTTSTRSGRWLTTEHVGRLVAARPDPGTLRADLTRHQLPVPDRLESALAGLGVDLERRATIHNDRVVRDELRERAGFLASIERSPLTEEQARAVVTLDNRVRVVAAAGSGKTSVMVARAAWTVQRGFVAPDRILLLAFNKAAAVELQERIVERFTAAGLDPSGVTARTFHSFGLSVIGQATGRKPDVPDWVVNGDVDHVMEIVDRLSDADPAFRHKWDLYRTLYGPAGDTPDGGRPDARTADHQDGYRTFNGEVVRSEGERLIANFMFLSGVDYRYEAPYVHDTADATHRQYRPDFHYPDADVWHEHWALDANGNPPESFTGYRESMAWKRTLHTGHGTTLVESTWAGMMGGNGLARLQTDLERHGIEFDWNPDREIPERSARPIEHLQLARLVRTFMAHVKSNRVDPTTLRPAAGSATSTRTRLFLDVFRAIHAAWQADLAAADGVDFEDMLNLAADHLHAGGYPDRFDMVCVDEFQDSSRARARFVTGLVRNPDRYLLAVGDDWQSINRFAGADLAVMTEFDDWFGPGPRLALTQTFRCTQTICDVARTFVTANPAQLDKPMRSVHGPGGPPVEVRTVTDPTDAIRQLLTDLAEEVVGEERDGPVTVDILGRYRFDRDVMPPAREVPDGVRVTFRTVHGSKGLEADVIVLPRMVTGTYRFPSTITDDPVLQLAMPAPETYPDAEERRLFYVALTRARHRVVLLTEQGRTSSFVAELLATHTDNGRVVSADVHGDPLYPCPVCMAGTMTLRNGSRRPFWGCTSYPACTHKLTGALHPTDDRGSCPSCEDGRLVPRTGKHGEFLGCHTWGWTECPG